MWKHFELHFIVLNKCISIISTIVKMAENLPRVTEKKAQYIGLQIPTSLDHWHLTTAGDQSGVIMGCCREEKTANIRAVSLDEQRSLNWKFRLAALEPEQSKNPYLSSGTRCNQHRKLQQLLHLKIQLPSSFRCRCIEYLAFRQLLHFSEWSDQNQKILICFKLGDNLKRLLSIFYKSRLSFTTVSVTTRCFN